MIDRQSTSQAMLLRSATLVAGVTGGFAALLGGDVGTALGVITLSVVIAVPLLRVAALAVRWVRQGDRRFGAAAFGVLAVTAAGAILAAAG